MKLRHTLFPVFLAALAGPALAEAPASSLRPMARAAQEAAPVQATLVRDTVKPTARPEGETKVPAAPGRVVLTSSGAAVLSSIRPEGRPDNLKRKNIVQASGIRTQPAPVIVQGRKGAICGIDGIKGEKLAPIPGRIKGCGVEDPIRVTSVGGVALSTPAIMDCTTATALNAWVDNSVRPAVGRLGGGVAGLQVAAHYACRSRNNQKGAKISEHGKGRAIYISAIVLKNGASLSVLKGWRDPQHGKVLKVVHKSACAFFGTVLGPGADRHHQDHIHLDTARYRSGSYCR